MPIISAPPNDYDKYGVFVRVPAPDGDEESWPDGLGRIIGPFDTWEEAADAADIEQRDDPTAYVRWAMMRRPGPEDVPPVRRVPRTPEPVDHEAEELRLRQAQGPKLVRDGEYDLDKMKVAVFAIREALGDNASAARVTIATLFGWAQVSDVFRRQAGEDHADPNSR